MPVPIVPERAARFRQRTYHRADVEIEENGILLAWVTHMVGSEEPKTRYPSRSPRLKSMYLGHICWPCFLYTAHVAAIERSAAATAIPVNPVNHEVAEAGEAWRLEQTKMHASAIELGPPLPEPC